MTEVLPTGWIRKSLKELIEPRGEKVSPSEYGDMPFLGMNHVEPHSLRILGSVPSLSMKSKAAKFYSDDVLYGRLRPYLNKVVHPSFEGLASAEFIVFPSNKVVNTKFLKYRLSTRDFVSFASHLNDGDRPRVNFDQIGDFKIHLPPENEQGRIVAKIEELLSELDKGIESLKTAREQLKVYRQALLKHAFKGKLTEQWRKDNADKLESADQLLERIKKEREARYQQQLGKWKAAVKQWETNGKEGKKPPKPKQPKELERPKPDASKGYQDIPASWLLVKIGDISSVGTGVTPLKSRSDYYDEDSIAWVTSGALNKSYVTAASGYVTELALEETNLRLYPVNTLLMAMYGEGKTRGKCSELLIPATTNQAIAAMVQCGLEEKTRQYLKWFLMKNYSDIRRKSSGGVQPNLNLGIVENTVFPLCPLDEMAVIIAELESQLSVIDDIGVTIGDQLLKSEALRQSILKKAFSGQLVPQDHDDEPASELLKRIAIEKSERAAQAKTTKAIRATARKKRAVKIT